MTQRIKITLTFNYLPGHGMACHAKAAEHKATCRTYKEKNKKLLRWVYVKVKADHTHINEQAEIK